MSIDAVIKFDHVAIVLKAAEELCYTDEFRKALSHLDTGVCMLQILQNGLDDYVTDEIKDTIQNALANVLDDMACIEYKSKNYKAAVYYQQLRINTLMGHGAGEAKAEDLLNWRALADAHSGMFAVLRLLAVEEETQGKLRCAMETLMLALRMLENCQRYKDNHVHLRETMLELARVLTLMGKERKARHFEMSSRSVEDNRGKDTCLYNTKEKIFVRPLHGEAPVLRYPNEAARAKASNYKASKEKVAEVAVLRQQMQGLGITVQQEAQVYESMFIRQERPAAGGAYLSAGKLCCMKYKEKQADLMMQELLEEEEKEKAAQKKPSRKQRRAKAKMQAAGEAGAACGAAGEAGAACGAGAAGEAGAACGAGKAGAAGAAGAAVKLDAEDLQHFQCPLTLEVMKNPVVTVDGHSFEESAIKLWLQKHDTSPMTNKVLESKILIPNIALKAAIEAAGVL